MDANSAQLASEPLKYQTWFLKVSIHCEGCRRKVKKVLRSIDGVFTTIIDPQQQKVTVTGSVGVETLIRKLVKAGKHAEIWPENLTGKGKATKKKNEQRDPESVKNHSAANAEYQKQGNESADKCNGESNSKDSKTGRKSPEKSPTGSQVPKREQKGGQTEEGCGKKKKKKGQSGGSGSNGLGSVSNNAPAHTGSQFQSAWQMNLSPTRQQSYSYPYAETYYPPLVYLANYNRIYDPMGTMDGPSYYVPPLPYMCAGLDHDPYPYQLQSTPFEIFSDENANWCSVM